MLPDNNIAIIIPAYKPTYFSNTLESLANQTDTAFNLYIGDDCSPFDLEPLIKPYKDALNITYFRFENNLGGQDLVAHWDRCLSLMNGETFFILFSDDDELEPNCIESLKKSIEVYEEDVLHFNLQIVNGVGMPLGLPTKFPENMSSMSFFDQLCTSEIVARMPEFV
ncbi:glycosyltransferase, partial [Brucella sp. 21LCYQ03]|nr:glycosyltransferase [Brucella sp. 21LCYQ03]